MMKCRCILVIVLLGSLAINIAQAEALLGLALQKSTLTDVMNLIKKSGAGITEDTPRLSRKGPNLPEVVTGRFITVMGGSLPGIREYINARFVFDSNEKLERYNLIYSLSNPGIFNERYQAVSSEYSNTKNSPGYALFAAENGGIILSEDHKKNQLIEIWEVDSRLALKSAPSGGNRGGSQCANACTANYNFCMQPSPISPRMGSSTDVQQNFAMTLCDSNYNSCLNSCPQNR